MFHFDSSAWSVAMLDDACTQYQLMLTENKFSASDYTTFINYFPLDNIFTLIMGFAAVALEHSPPSIFPPPTWDRLNNLLEGNHESLLTTDSARAALTLLVLPNMVELLCNEIIVARTPHLVVKEFGNDRAAVMLKMCCPRPSIVTIDFKRQSTQEQVWTCHCLAGNFLIRHLIPLSTRKPNSPQS